MTGRQIEKLSDFAGQLGVAAILGGVGDAVLSGARRGFDFFGIAVGAVLLATSLYLLGLIQG